MSTVKNTNSDYTIQTPKTANITLNTDWVRINGNLEVLGNTVSITTTDTNILDNTIILNYGETGAGITKGNAGIAVDRGTQPNVELRYNDGINAWEATNDGTNYLPLTGLSAVVDDTTPELGGNLYTNGFALISDTDFKIGFVGNLQIVNTVTEPTAEVNSAVLYAQPPQAGQAGLYVVNEASTNEELVTKRRALGFSMIL